MTLKKLASKIHLWFGLATGLVVIIVGITGAIYCFAPELQQNFQPYRSVQSENVNFLPPSLIKKIAERELPGKLIQRIYYDAGNKSVMVLFSNKEEYNYSVFINPYNGKVLKVRNNNKDFLSVVLQIHRTLKIPYGHEIIQWSTVIFVLMLISGIILWWPKRKRTAKQGFVIMWRASPKRLNYDLHKVLGFYISWIALFSAVTGLMFAFKGFANFTYKLTGAKHSIVQTNPPFSDTTLTREDNPLDNIWKKMAPQLHNKYAALMFVFPATSEGAILVRANPQTSTLYKTDFLYFNQNNGEAIPGSYVWGKFADAKTTSDHIRRMNYDLHTGAFFGLPGRIALFFASLIVVSLPITGFYFWWGKRRKSKKVKMSN